MAKGLVYKIVLFIFLFTLLNYSVIGFTSTEDEKELVIMSFNVQDAKDSNKYFNKWEKRRHLVIETIRHINPDLIGFQELDDVQLQFLTEELSKDYKQIAKSNADAQNPIYNCIFYRPDRLDLLDSGIFWLSTEPNREGSKSWDSEKINSVTWANFKYRRYQFLFLNTQFDEKSDKTKIESAKLIWDQVRAMTDGHVFLVGTLNANDESPAIRYLLGKPETDKKQKGNMSATVPVKAQNQGEIDKKPNFIDSFKIASTISGTSGKDTLHNYKGYLSDSNSGRIDWIFVRKGVFVSRAEFVTYHQLSSYPSDHYPIAIRVSFDPRTGDWSDANKKTGPVSREDTTLAYDFIDRSYIKDYKSGIEAEKKEARKRMEEYNKSKKKKKHSLNDN